MDLNSFAEGPLLWIVFLLFLTGVSARLVFFGIKIITSPKAEQSGWGFTMPIFGRFLLPFHKAIPQKPLYAVIRYVFHLSLFIVPIWLGSHVSLWEESRLGWSWSTIPDKTADRMTLLVIALALFFLARRVFWPEARRRTSWTDFIVIFIAGLPFFTGWCLSHGTLDKIAFLGDNMRLIHVLSGEAMILMAVFLFSGTRLNPSRCTGCAACELSCPTGTLESKDKGTLRIFNYSHYQCICCGACVNTCPEDAAELRHEISARNFFRILPKQEIRSVEMKRCQKCGALFVPEALFDKINRTFTDDYLRLCPNCRKSNVVSLYRRMTPWIRKRSVASQSAR
jgi:formate hydrogenlyase subunit 6/NADH:ubiquinone oxidoreductase subunit I